MDEEVRGRLSRYERPKFDRCIFCGGPANSKEHLLPDWLRRALKEEPGDFVDLRWAEDQGGEEAAVAQRGNGGVNSVKLRCVCEPCNNGWMSALQNAAKPVLHQLAVDGTWPIFSPDQRLAVARWSAMASMVYDAADGASQTFLQSDRTALYQRSELPTYFAVWIGRRAVDQTGRWAGHCSYNEAPGLPMHSQATVFGLARASLISFSSQAPLTFSAFWMANRLAMRTIWPDPDPQMNQPPPRSLVDDQLQTLYGLTAYLRRAERINEVKESRARRIPGAV